MKTGIHKTVVDGLDDVTVRIDDKGLTADVIMSKVEYIHDEKQLGK